MLTIVQRHEKGRHLQEVPTVSALSFNCFGCLQNGICLAAMRLLPVNTPAHQLWVMLGVAMLV